MQLPFFKKKVINQTVYLGLLLKESEGMALVIKEEKGTKVCIDKEQINYSNGWDSLIEDVDQVIFQLENKLKLRFDQTIFYIYSHFIDEKTHEIKNSYLSKIKDLTRKLELTPLGYIECYEAIHHLLEKKEELPLTAIIVELDQTKLSVFIYKGGSLAFNKVADRTDSLVDDFLSCIGDLKGKMLLPSRIIIYNSKDLDEEVSKFLTYRWNEDFFIQLPRVEMVKKKEIISGLVKVFEEQIETSKQPDNKVEFKEEKKTEILGFVIGADVDDNKHQEEISIDENKTIKKSVDIKAVLIGYLEKFTARLKSLKMNHPKNFGLITLALGAAFILISLFLNEYYFHTAKLTVYLPSHKINKSLKFQSDIKIYLATVSADFLQSQSTTGNKEIGEKAKGQVTVHNFSGSSRLFKSGSTIETIGIKFILDQDINVASSSNILVDGNLVKQPGKAKAPVSASEIGPQFNLEKGKQFSIDGLSLDTYLAINDAAFSGGTKKEVRTVSKKDTEALDNLILEKAKNQDKNKDLYKLTDNDQIIEDLSKFSFGDQKFSKEVGEEADTVSLEAKVITTLYYLKKNELMAYIIKCLSSELPSGFKLEKERIIYKFSKASEKNGQVNFDIEVSAIGVKDVSKDQIVKSILGKNKGKIDKIFETGFTIKGFNVAIKQPLPLLKNWLPIFKKNISLNFTAL